MADQPTTTCSLLRIRYDLHWAYGKLHAKVRDHAGACACRVCVALRLTVEARDLITDEMRETECGPISGAQ